MSAVTVPDAASATPDQATVAAFYDARVGGKLADFVRANPRIEAAVETLAEWAPLSPNRVLEIGCGVGATAWRMARAWPNAEVIGLDLSPASIEAAQTCFRRPNLSFRTGRLEACGLEGVFDLVLMMDVYEHVAPAERAALHGALDRLLADESRCVLTVPSAAQQDYLRGHRPDGLQPIDETIGPTQILALAEATRMRLLSYRELGVWRYGDYLHAVLSRGENLRPVALRQARRGGVQRLKDLLKAILGRWAAPPALARNLLGVDAASPERAGIARRFRVSAAERRRLAAALRRD
jgi:SAM-dependent methyltransferase